MRYLVIGLGIFGSNLARDLTDMGNEVIGADDKQICVDAIKDYISTVYLVDTTEESSLSVLPLTNVDVVIVCIGEDFGASVRTVALLKKAGVKHIYARATDEVHQAILEGFGIDRILTPEQRAAWDLAHEMELGPGFVTLPIDDKRLVITFEVPAQLVGMSWSQMRLERDYGLRLVAAGHPVRQNNILGVSHTVYQPVDIDDSSAICQAGDQLTVLGTRKQMKTFIKNFS